MFQEPLTNKLDTKEYAMQSNNKWQLFQLQYSSMQAMKYIEDVQLCHIVVKLNISFPLSNVWDMKENVRILLDEGFTHFIFEIIGEIIKETLRIIQDKGFV